MRIIANILTDKNFVAGDYYNVVSDKKDLKEGVPTLVIGWDFTKSQYPDASIIEWEIDENTFWTFGNREKRPEYERRLEKFNSLVVDRLVKSVNYKPMNLMSVSKEEKVELNHYIDSTCEKLVYYSYDMVYIYVPYIETVFGVYLKEIDYIGKSAKQFLAKLDASPNKKSITVKASENIPNYMWNVLRTRQYVVPTLFYDNQD